MGRTYVAETAVQQYIDSLLGLHDSAVGLIVGQVIIVARHVYPVAMLRVGVIFVRMDGS